MAKKFGKLVLFSALAGAAAAGTYYYLQKKNDDPLKDMDDIDDFDDFDDDFDDDNDDSEDISHGKNHSYVSLDLENAKEIIGEKVIETIDKTKEKIVQFNVAEKLDKAKEFVEEITSPETAYTTASPVEETAESSVSPVEPTEVVPPTVSVSSTYQDDAEADETEEFFDDDELE